MNKKIELDPDQVLYLKTIEKHSTKKEIADVTRYSIDEIDILYDELKAMGLIEIKRTQGVLGFYLTQKGKQTLMEYKNLLNNNDESFL